MSEQTSTRPRPHAAPSVYQIARDLYGTAFEQKSRNEVGKAMADWSELSEEERSFALGHLLYLNLQAQGGTNRLLREIRDTLEETDEAVQAMADELVVEEDDSSEGDEQSETPEADDDADLESDAHRTAPDVSEPAAEHVIPSAAREDSLPRMADVGVTTAPQEGGSDEG